jgi:hypothetical protein
MDIKIQKCPTCNKTTREVRSWVQCPKIKALVCMTHCVGCSYCTDMIRCTYTKEKAKQKKHITLTYGG